MAQAGPLDESLRYAFDVDQFIRLAAVGEYIATREVLSAAIIHDEAKTQAGRLGMHVETMAVQIRHGRRDAAEARLARVLERASKQRSVRGRMLKRLGRALPGIQTWRTTSPDQNQFPLRDLQPDRPYSVRLES